MFRRTLLVAVTLLLAWAAPASAQSYGDVLGQGQTRPVVVENGGGQAVGGAGVGSGQGIGAGSSQGAGSGQGAAAGGNLARTGSETLVPLAQGAVLLIGLGSLLALAARRRRAQAQPLSA